MNLERKIESLLEEISGVCKEAGRNPKDVTIIGASKSQNLKTIQKVQKSGIKHFGENFLQEAESKIINLYPSPVWHFIGTIQSRKAKKISSLFNWVHTVDRLKVAEKLDKNRNKEQGKLNICVQVNLEKETTKSGIPLEGCEIFISDLKKLTRLNVRGLMAIPKPTNNFEQQRRVFARIRSYFERLKLTYPQLDTLSIGMSGDYRAAILEGATMLRIGTAVFGERK